jgi:hypothetical protein
VKESPNRRLFFILAFSLDRFSVSSDAIVAVLAGVEAAIALREARKAVDSDQLAAAEPLDNAG